MFNLLFKLKLNFVVIVLVVFGKNISNLLEVKDV